MKPKFMRLTFVILFVAACVVSTERRADAHITKIQIISKESPTFGGYSWPGVGQYEKIVGKAFGEIDPNDAKNSVIVDLKLGPRNGRGKVEYSFDFYILKPLDLAKGNHKVVYEPPNRGRKTIGSIDPSLGGNDPGSATQASLLASSFFLPQGYSIVFSGWDVSARRSSANFGTTITVPIAKNSDGSTIVGQTPQSVQDLLKEWAESGWTPMLRRCTPKDIADVCALLCSDEARFMTGQALSVHGGSSLMNPEFPLPIQIPLARSTA